MLDKTIKGAYMRCVFRKCDTFHQVEFSMEFEAPVILRLEFAEERVDDFPVAAGCIDEIFCELDSAIVRVRILEGTDKANLQLGTKFNPKSATYIVIGSSEDVFANLCRAAFAIVERLALCGESRYEAELVVAQPQPNVERHEELKRLTEKICNRCRKPCVPAQSYCPKCGSTLPAATPRATTIRLVLCKGSERQVHQCVDIEQAFDKAWPWIMDDYIAQITDGDGILKLTRTLSKGVIITEYPLIALK